MDNILTYIKFRQDISFKQVPFNEADAMVFTMLVGIDLNFVKDKMPLREVAARYQENIDRDLLDERMKDKEEVLFLAAKALRYKDVFLENFERKIDEEKEKTFYGLTIYTDKHNAYVAFRGTDGSLLSWKENFNGLYMFPTPGQQDALEYLGKVCLKRHLKVSPMGHSKGGNLALYAAMYLEPRLQKRIKNIFLFDAPGFIDEIQYKLGFLAIKDRIQAYVPESCVIGNLMLTGYDRKVVKGEGTGGIYQHDMFNWCMTGTGLELADQVNEFGNNLSKTVNDWINSIPIEKRKDVVDELFGVFFKNGILHITDLMHMDLKKIIAVIKCLTSLSSENRELLEIIIKQLRNNK